MKEKYLNLFWLYMLLAIIAFFLKIILRIFVDQSPSLIHIIFILHFLFNFKTFITISIILIAFAISSEPLPIKLLKKLKTIHKKRSSLLIVREEPDKDSDSYLDKF